MDDIKATVIAARKAGWTVEQSKRNSHWKFLSPNRSVKPIFTSSSTGDVRAVKNLHAELRRAGLALR
ncbi:hypothetical protein H7J07_05335 [Mycobacterium koreense]|uniref:hypothetical protein n=1 Tax=Mycolicibacillus koreensis TaxID=1069220 RepID=UPI000D6A72F7|nr:hypothetical protein [Mycolicibacillus koreensis]MCV7247647.1 hypothetical protein [Mycolicibacillus koreensis]BBY54030.1 hypothetical protein MKOR_12810 [Mycolicibacillus koreensis]